MTSHSQTRCTPARLATSAKKEEEEEQKKSSVDFKLLLNSIQMVHFPKGNLKKNGALENGTVY